MYSLKTKYVENPDRRNKKNKRSRCTFDFLTFIFPQKTQKPKYSIH